MAYRPQPKKSRAVIANPKRPPLRDRKWLNYVATLPCAVCRTTEAVVPAHIGHSSISMKDDDFAVLPLCFQHHADLDGAGEWRGGKEKWLVKNFVRPTLEDAYFRWKKQHR